MSDASEKILKEIHERHVTHRPKWQFLIKDASIWTALAAVIFFGALSISIEESVLERGFGIGGAFGFGSVRLLLQGVSLLWIASTAIFVVLAFLNLRHIKEGYRWRTLWIVIGIVAVIVTLGFLFRQEGVGDRAESALEHNSFYNGAFHINHPDNDGPYPIQQPYGAGNP